MLTPRENYIRFLKNEACEWTPTNADQLQFRPTLILDHVARGMVAQQNPYTGSYGGKDLFGIDWVFEPSVGGSMEVAPLFDDIEEWEDHVVFPDVDAMDWEGCAKENAECTSRPAGVIARKKLLDSNLRIKINVIANICNAKAALTEHFAH